MRLPPQRSFRLILTATIVSQLGDWAARLALALLVFQRTGSEALVGVTAALLIAPWLGPGQWLAHITGRFDRRRLLIACDATRGAAFLLIGFLHLPLPALLALVLFVAAIDPIFEANRSAMIVDIVPKTDYPDAIQSIHSVNQAAQLAGFGLGGVLAAAFTPSGALAVNGATFLLSAALIRAIKPADTSSERSHTNPSFKQAFRFLATDPISLTAVAATAATTSLGAVAETQAPVYGELVAGLGPTGLGLLAATIPFITLVMVWGLDNTGGDHQLLNRGALISFTFAIPAAGLLWLAPDQPAVFVGFACVGAVFVFSTTANIVVGRRIPADIRPGTFAVLQAAVYVSIGVGAFAGGFLSQATTPQTSAGLTMAACVAVCGVTILRIRSLNTAQAAIPATL